MGSIDEEICRAAQMFLDRMRSLLATNDFQISLRDKNQEFLEKYKLKEQRIKEMLLALISADCKAVEPNDNPRYSDALVYKFIKQYELEYFSEICNVIVYIKLYIVEYKTYDLVMVISFHEVE